MAGSKCDVCERERETRVAASPFGPISFAYCQECIQKPAEPLLTFNYLYENVSSDQGRDLHESINNWFTWLNGQYLSWPDYVAQRRAEG